MACPVAHTTDSLADMGVSTQSGHTMIGLTTTACHSGSRPHKLQDVLYRCVWLQYPGFHTCRHKPVYQNSDTCKCLLHQLGYGLR